MFPQMPFHFPMFDISELLGMLGAWLAVVASVSLAAAAFGVLVYILHSLGLYTIALRREIKHPWLAWLPFGDLWILGSISDQYQYVTQGRVKSRRKLLLGLRIAICVAALAVAGVTVAALVQAVANLFGGAGNISIGIVIADVVLNLILAVLGILLTVFYYISLYNLFASCNPDYKVLFLLLSIFIGVIQPFLVFACRKKDQGMPPKRTDPLCYQTADPEPFTESFEE